MPFLATLITVVMLVSNTGTWATDHRSGERRSVHAAPARVLSSLGAKDAIALSPTKPSDDNTGSADSQDSQDSQGRARNPWRGSARVASLPFDEMVKHAVDHELYYREHTEHWQSHLWEFTRIVKSYYKENVKAEAAFKNVDREIRRRHGGWYFAGIDDETAHAEFVHAWKKIRFIQGESPVWQALQKANAFPVKAPTNPDRERPTPGYDRFISLVGWLQVIAGDNPIYLPVRLIAEALETDQRMVSIWRQMAVDDGFMDLVREHDTGRRRATEFRVKPQIVERFKQYASRQL